MYTQVKTKKESVFCTILGYVRSVECIHQEINGIFGLYRRTPERGSFILY